MRLNNIIYISALVAATLSGCKKESFVEANTDETILAGIKPEEQFLNAGIRAHNSDFEAYYDFYRRIMPWMQQAVFQQGNSKNFLNDVGNFNQRYNVFYPQLGSILTDVQVIIDNMPAEEKAKRVHMRAIPDILKVYYAFYVSDINGSIPYSDAFMARYGGNLTPAFQSQPELFNIWDAKLKEVIGILKTTPSVTQVSLGNNDLYYKGDASKWVKAANALRMKMAFRLMKRDEAKAKAIITEVLADAAQMENNNDSWVMYADVSFNNGGNWDPTGFRAPKPTVDFMWNNSDPRIRMFYQKNNYTQENLNTAKAAGTYPASTTWNPRQYVGAHISPDSALGQYRTWFTTKMVNSSLTLDTISYLQYRMWMPASNNGTGKNFFPIITYADYALMRAEAIARNYVSGNAEEWYNKGVEASIRFYSTAATNAQVTEHTPVTDAEIAAYLNAPDVKFNAAKALEQIAIQSYLNYYKQPNEAWALYKRTGMPNKNTALKNEDIVIDAVVRDIPRRASIAPPLSTDPNYATRKAALDEMAKDPEFGQGPNDVFGRVWWDKR
ncbi:SusD/RagB family nutrient-binding outer membrane lipoprotein [Paracnuella aquatica]|uniref:SusD/RagB family nutrient-binding outer membrane lipoprotein n=1 Tax=Paracnuella aquatica TaxID=2268757 RepID=UPI000DEF8081|nr:SusD/RagB family nutrient-binding outer membrane lipoprotein [Paracnuella aquatica]RPD45557.1 SusD/RagB family nutrient-binding outer membrane lipoprotein [Paracnuella aquatica]